MSKEATMEKTSLPVGWEMKKLIELGEVQTGTTPSTSNKGFYGDFIPFVKPPHFNPDGTISFSSSGLSEIGLAKGRLIKENSILMVCIGASIGKTGITPIPISCNQQINAFSPNENCLPKFYYHLLSSDYFFRKVMKRSSQATLPMINKTKWQNIEIPLPPLPQQKQIVAILDKAFAAIDIAKANAQQNLQNAAALFESYLQNVFDPSTPSGREGDDWEEYELSEIVDKRCSLSYGIVQPGDEFPNGIPVIRPTNMKNKFVYSLGLKLIDPTKAESYKRTSLVGDELLLCVRGETGVTSLITDKLKGANVTRGIVPVCFDSDKLSLLFGYYLFVSPFVQKQIKDKTYGAALMQINIRDVRKLIMRIPSKKEQKQIVQKLDAVSIKTKKLEAIYTQKIANLEELKKSVLQKAFSGQLIKTKKN